MKLLALVLLLSTFSSLTLTEVVNSFKQSCPSLFIRTPEKQNDIIIPTIFSGRQYKTICQRWKNSYRFATVYDTVRRIPVYSAYTFIQTGETRRTEDWKIEPQLDNIKKDTTGKEIKDMKEMMESPNRAMATAMNITHQAVDSDYSGGWYDRGHVFPHLFAADQNQANSTFTLTNIAPQTGNSNRAWAEQVEEPMLEYIINNCRLDQNHKAYIVTGVVPGKKWTPITRNQRHVEGINIPSYYWTAFCCTNKTDIKKRIAGAYIAKQENFNVRQPSIDDLNKRLTGLYNQSFSVFPGLNL